MKYFIFRIRSACRWYFQAKTRYDVHSPALSNFIERVWRDRKEVKVDAIILDFRRWYRQQKDWVATPQLGAASKVRNRQRRRLSEIVKHSAIAPPEGRLLARLACYTQARNILELGTNAGISGAYLALGQPDAQLVTIEGNPDLARQASAGFKRLGLAERIRVITGSFEEELPTVLAEIQSLELLFIDGDHRYQPTITHLSACLPLATNKSIFIIADIHWSSEMEKAWEEVRNWPEVATSIDTYHFGLLFFNQQLQGVSALSLIKTRFKPWRLGFW